MLVAYGPDGSPLVAEEASLTELQRWSHERLLHCPNCRGIVHVRGGPEKRTQLHFAHQKGECAWSTESESVRHMRGKLVLAQWLRDQFPRATVTLEERLPEPNRIADIFMQLPDGRRWALEFQCAPLDLAEWQHRHNAYRQAGIIDTWIIGNNRREKQEAFIEAVLGAAHEIMFLDPLLTPPRIWLRWLLSSSVVQEWQRTTTRMPLVEGRIGRLGYGASLTGRLYDVSLDEESRLIHPARSTMEKRLHLLQTMAGASSLAETLLTAYLRDSVGEEALRVVILPLLRAYVRDPDLLRRYNYGRGAGEQPVDEEDRRRVHNACAWLASLAQRGYSPEALQMLVKELPFVGPYAAFARYAEMLLAVASPA